MTLRLVNDNHQPDDRLYCQSSCYPTKPATILVSINSGLEWSPYLPMCDECARHKHQAFPGFVRLAPLAEYVDHFAAAREAALATPEQVTEPLVSEAYLAIGLCIRRDRRLYCQEYWCCLAYSQDGRLTAADVITQVAGYQEHLTCNECARKRQEERGPGQISTWTLDEQRISKFWRLFDGYQAERVSAAPAGNGFTAEERAARAARPRNARTGTARREIPAAGWGVTAIISLVLGFVLCLAGLPDGTQIGSEANMPLIIIGVLLILTAITTGLIALVKRLDEHDRSHPARPAAAPAQQRAAGSYQQGIPVGQLAMNALPWVAWGIAEHRRREHHRQAVAAVHAHSAQYKADAAQRERDATQQAILGELQQMNDPGPVYGTQHLTRRSDIYGNLI